MLGIDSPKEQLKILETILKNALSVRDTERLLQNLKKTGPEKKKMKKDPYVADVERNLSKIMMTRVQIYLNQKKAGRIEILFNSAEDLDRLIKVLMDE